jgi:hypothetical protein
MTTYTKSSTAMVAPIDFYRLNTREDGSQYLVFICPTMEGVEFGKWAFACGHTGWIPEVLGQEVSHWHTVFAYSCWRPNEGVLTFPAYFARPCPECTTVKTRDYISGAY